MASGAATTYPTSCAAWADCSASPGVPQAPVPPVQLPAFQHRGGPRRIHRRGRRERRAVLESPNRLPGLLCDLSGWSWQAFQRESSGAAQHGVLRRRRGLRLPSPSPNRKPDLGGNMLSAQPGLTIQCPRAGPPALNHQCPRPRSIREGNRSGYGTRRQALWATQIDEPFEGFVLTPQAVSASYLVLGPVLHRSGL